MKVITVYYRILEKIKNIEYRKFIIVNREKNHLLKNNAKFKNIHKGDRCFILGNGPSLKQQDLALLSNEYVFTVNQIMRNPDFYKLKTNYHFWADPMFFKIDENKKEDLELLKVMKSVNTKNNKPECFFPVHEKEFIEKYKIDKTISVNYFYSSSVFYDDYNRDIDYTTNTPGFGTVVQWAITMAIYMGFEEIYLLGCDNTGIIVSIKSILKENSDMDYAYEVTDNEKNRMEKLLEEKSLEDYCNTYVSTLAGYRRLFSYCKKKNIKLFNCSAQTTIDSIPRVKYEDIIHK